jgi:hypothetical protein
MTEQWAAGRALDAEIARRVFGHAVKESDAGGIFTYDDSSGYWLHVPRYSTDMAAAWSVVERLGHLYHPVMLTDLGPEWTLRWLVQIKSRHVAAREATAPLAICYAALAAMGAIDE